MLSHSSKARRVLECVARGPAGVPRPPPQHQDQPQSDLGGKAKATLEPQVPSHPGPQLALGYFPA